jgi:hypothetical protein
MNARGEAHFSHAPPDAEYALLVGPFPVGRVGWLPSVRPGSRTIEVTLEPGVRARGTLHVPATDWTGSVTLEHGGFEFEGTVDPDGVFEVPGVPPGEWTIRATAKTLAQHDGQPLRFAGRAPARAGAAVDVRLERVEPVEGPDLVIEIEEVLGGLACGGK